MRGRQLGAWLRGDLSLQHVRMLALSSLLVLLGIGILARVADTQTCPVYTAGITSTDEASSNTISAIYVNALSNYAAKCNGTVYAWHYCYYDENSDTNVEAAFGVYSFSDNVYSLREGSYYLLHLNSREDTFTCDTVTLDSTEYFQIQAGDRVGACLRQNGNTDYLDILFDTPLISLNYVHLWSQSSGSCTEDDMTTSPAIQFPANYRSNNLHLYVDINIDECDLSEDNCHENAICSDTVGGSGSFQCTCKTGYTGNGVTCTNIDECNIGTHICGVDAMCTDSDGSYTCTCNTGYAGDGTTCTNIDECITDVHTCALEAICIDTIGSFTCECNAGYTGDGSTCTDIDECLQSSNNCSHNANCDNTMGGYSCNCMNGYEGDGLECRDINECLNLQQCGPGGQCQNNEGSYLCQCSNGYIAEYNHTFCTDIDECVDERDNCAAKATCTNTNGSFTCDCHPGYTGNGIACSDIDECIDGSNQCDINSECTNTNGSYTCTCRAGYSGNGINCTDVDECTSSGICIGADVCENTDGSYMCLCSTHGLTWNGTDCEVLPEVVSTGQERDENGVGVGLIVGITMGALVIIVLVVVISVVCAVKIRTHSKSENLPVQTIGYENSVYGLVDDNIQQMSSLEKDHDVKESLTRTYDSVTNPALIDDNRTTDDTLLEYYTAIDYYSTINDYNSTEEDYDEMLKKAERSGETVRTEENDLYYSPAQREDEIYQQLKKQRIKAIPKSHIEQLGKIGSGEFGTVCKGRWTCSNQVLDVAIKVLSNASDESSRVKFLQEAAIMSQFRHPNVIKLYGVVTDADQIMLVVELLEKGDLLHALARMRPDPGQLNNPSLPLTLLAFSRQTALGMVYLSRKGFIHRDIAARNILLSRNNICKICDFGMSRDLEEDNYYVSHGGKVPVKWTAPEAMVYKKYSTASDVWSYGCLLYEIWSLGYKPFTGASNQDVIHKVESGYRLPPPAGCPKAIYSLMMDCWNPDPSARPKFQHVLNFLLGNENVLLLVPEEDRASHSQGGILGSPLEAGYRMYLSEQHRYQTGGSAEMTQM